MEIIHEKLWAILIEKAEEEDNSLPVDQHIASEYVSGIKNICKFALDRAITIRDTFPMYTLHDVTHICNVMRIMVSLLGEYANLLSRDEVTMLILAACCHDIGMSYSDDDKSELFADIDRLKQYLDRNHGEYVKAYTNGNDIPTMTDDMIQNYLRSIHHDRIMELLCNFEWPAILEGKVNREDLMRVCQSHGKDISSLDELEQTPTIDLRFCAILLRLSDVLDFDTSRAPQAVYDYSGINSKESAGVIKSKEEWRKHMSSHGFDFEHIPDRSYSYMLNYSATSKSMQIEQTINCYLDWVDEELSNCGKQIKRFVGKWQNIILPGKIKRNIKSEGYLSGQYRLTLDQDQVMELLVGKDLYSDPSVFVRELIQNAIDAVRTRKQLDNNLPTYWKAQINIRSWMDDEGYHWFRIEDNGIGMTEDTIMNFFLKIGRSYYTSETFQQAKLRCKADPDYMPISRFGIGILSCFMGDKGTNRVEVSTKHFNEYGIYYPALRLSMHGMNGYYYMASKEKNHLPGPMKGVTQKEKEQYLKQAGTVIAVRTNLYQTGKYKGFKEIVDRYVVFPPAAIHYDGVEGSFDYLTESDFISSIHEIQPSIDLNENSLEFLLSKSQLNEINDERPELSFSECPKILLKCIPLDYYTDSPFLTGAVLTAKVIGNHDPITINLGKRKELANVKIELFVDNATNELGLKISLVFGKNFSRKMDLVEENGPHNRIYFELHEDDPYISDIIEAFYHSDINNPRWKDYMKQKYNVSSSELSKKIREIDDKIKRNSDISREDIETFHAYQTIIKEWRFIACKLSQFDWYTKYFNDIKNKTGIHSLVAHNGILCGNGDFFVTTAYKQNLGTIVLLKDKYRPNIDVARDSIRTLTLEASSDLEVIRNYINSHGFNLVADMAGIDEVGYSYLPMKMYCSLLEQRSDLVKKVMINTDKGIYSLEDLCAKVQEYGKMRIINFPLISNRSYWGSKKNGNLYAYLGAAYIRKNFSLRLKLEKYYSEVYVLAKDWDNSCSYDEILPSNFFIAPLESNCKILTTGNLYQRYGCNANHCFSVWIQKNCISLHKYVPGIFKEMLRVIGEEAGENLVNNVNELLLRLRNIPSELFNIPDELFITLEDLC